MKDIGYPKLVNYSPSPIRKLQDKTENMTYLKREYKNYKIKIKKFSYRLGFLK